MRIQELFEHTIDILAVCTGNICRSPIAEGILKGMPQQCLTVSSAGTHAIDGNQATEFAVIAAAEHGIDLSGHRARVLTPETIRESRFILCMEREHLEWVLSVDPSARTRVFNLARFAVSSRTLNSIRDPYGCSLGDYRECFGDLLHCIRNFAQAHIPFSG